MTEAPDRIWAKLVPDQFGPSGFGLIVDHVAFDGAVEFVPRAELEAAVLAERVTLDQVISEADEIRNTFCLGLPGTDAEFKAWIHGFDTAVAHFAAAIRSRGEPV